MVNASAIVTGIRHTVVDVCFAMRAVEPRHTFTCVHVYAVDACGVVLTWIGRTVVDVCGAVISCITVVTEALLLRCGRVV